MESLVPNIGTTRRTHDAYLDFAEDPTEKFGLPQWISESAGRQNPTSDYIGLFGPFSANSEPHFTA